MSYTPARPRMKHQDAALLAAASAPDRPCSDDAFAFLMDYGTGKSQVILDEWGQMCDAGGPRDLLVVAGKGSIRNWYADKSDLQKSEISNMDPEFRSRLRVSHVGAGSAALERFLAASAQTDEPRALFVNVEALSRPGRARRLVERFVSQRLCYGAIDESTIVKGRKSERSKFLVKQIAPELAVRRIATGMLTPQGPMDAWAQFSFLSRDILGCRSYQDFQGRYAVTVPMTVRHFAHGQVREREIQVIRDYRNLDELQERIGAYSFRVLKSECLDLEPKKYVIWDCEHTPEQARVYRELRDEAVTELGDGAHCSSSSVMTRVMRLHQINCGFAVDESGAVHDLPSRREDDLCEILGLHAGKAVIWTPFLRPVKKIRAALEREFGDPENPARTARLVAEFTGANAKTRAEDERRFVGDPECRFMIATQSAGGRGNTWTCADLEVYYANSNDLEQRYNSEDRLHRKGQTNRVTVVDMIVPDTVDMKIVRRLRKKIDLATTLTGEGAREWLI